jgi:hypothetical protein
VHGVGVQADGKFNCDPLFFLFAYKSSPFRMQPQTTVAIKTAAIAYLMGAEQPGLSLSMVGGADAFYSNNNSMAPRQLTEMADEQHPTRGRTTL